jgi:hypothetical protein
MQYSYRITINLIAFQYEQSYREAKELMYFIINLLSAGHQQSYREAKNSSSFYHPKKKLASGDVMNPDCSQKARRWRSCGASIFLQSQIFTSY